MSIIETDLLGKTIDTWQPVQIGADVAFDEKWLQNILYDHPSALPLAEIDPLAANSVSVCRELKLGRGLLDLLLVSPKGRLTLVECKLWRNHEARRKVIGQILEYAAELARLRLADVEALVRAKRKTTVDNPFFDLVRALPETSSEKDFTGCLDRGLQGGEFCLVIAGDGIRPEAQVIAEFLRASGNLGFSLGFIQVDLHRRGQRLLVQPRVPVRVQSEFRTVFVGSAGLAEANGGDAANGVSAADPGAPDDPLAQSDREFWQAFISQVKLQHPDQPGPQHGGRNWVKLSFPPPAGWLTLYRSRGSKHRLGAFLWFKSAEGRDKFEQLQGEREEIEAEFGAPLRWQRSDSSGRMSVAISQDWPNIDDQSTYDAQRAWLSDIANRMVNTFRPRVRAVSG